MLLRLADWFAGLEGRGRWLSAMLLGVLATAAMPPWHVLPLLLPAFVGLIWMLRGAEGPGQAMAIGWAWGLGHFVAGCYWIVEAYFVPPADFAAWGPPMVLGLSLVLGLFPGFAAAAMVWISGRWPGRWNGWPAIVVFAAAFSVGEWVRSWLLTGFPWNPLGHVWAFSTAMLQSASLWGVFGLGFVTVLAACLPAALAAPGRGRGLLAVALGLPVLLLGALYFAGTGRIGSQPSPQTTTWVRLVQPNIPQGEKWRPELQARHLAHLLSLTIAPRPHPQAGVTHVIWPETAVPFLLEESPETLRRLGAVLDEGALLIVGTPRSETDPARRYGDGRRPIYNSLLAVDRSGKVQASYDKAHLVPFGEYLPFHDLLPILGDTIGRGSFAAGPGPRTLSVPGLPSFAPVICYEAIFPGAVAPRHSRPAWLLNLTNDSWFGVSAGPYQHLVSARLRSVEEGLPMVRVANTGISAVIDAHGRVTASIAIDLPGTLDRPLPAALPATPFVRFGIAPWVVLLLAGLAAAGLMPRGWTTPRND